VKSQLKRRRLNGGRNAKLLGDPANARFVLDDSPFYLIARTSGRYTLDMERILKTIGMDIPRWRALMIVNQRGPCSVSEIADMAVMRLSTVTRVVQRLEKLGHVRLATRASDGRRTDVYLTPQGRAAVKRVRKVASRIYNMAFHDFEPTEIAKLNILLRRVFHNLAWMP
jgi:MarR family transcriptional regulator, organic hydroperoxide resistance regulator